MLDVKNILKDTKKFSQLEIAEKYKYYLYFLDKNNHLTLSNLLINSFDKLFFSEKNWLNTLFEKSNYSNYLEDNNIYSEFVFNRVNIDILSNYYFKKYYNITRILNSNINALSFYSEFFDTLLFHRLYKSVLFSLSWNKYCANLRDESVNIDLYKFSLMDKKFIEPLKIYKIKKKKSQERKEKLDQKSKKNKKKERLIMNKLLKLVNSEQVKNFRLQMLYQIYNKIVLVRYLLVNKFIKYLTKNGKKDKAINICFRFLLLIYKNNIKQYWLNLNKNAALKVEKNFDLDINLKDIDLNGLGIVLFNRKQQILYKNIVKDIKSNQFIKNNMLNLNSNKILTNLDNVNSVQNLMDINKINNKSVKFIKDYIKKNYKFIQHRYYNKNLAPVLDLFFKTIALVSPSFRIIIKYIAGEKMYLPIPLHADKKLFYGLKNFIDCSRQKKRNSMSMLNSLVVEFNYLQNPRTYNKSFTYLKLVNTHKTALNSRDQLKYL